MTQNRQPARQAAILFNFTVQVWVTDTTVIAYKQMIICSTKSVTIYHPWIYTVNICHLMDYALV